MNQFDRRGPSRPWAAFACLTFLLSACSANETATSSSTSAETNTPVAPSGLELRQLSIESSGRTHHFRVEIAQSPEEQARGLMFRNELAPDSGMLFPFEKEREASFWMKNTVIPLDIVFVRTDGSIESIAAETEPYSLDPIRSGEPVAAVLEIAGGRAAQLGIVPGDIVTWQN